MYGSSDEHPHGENVIYYLTVYNEPVIQPKEPENVDVEGLLKGIHHVAVPPKVEHGNGTPPRVQLLASGVAFPWITDAQRMLAEDWGVAADTWSVTSWNELARDAVAAEEHNLLHPSDEARTPYVTFKLKEAPGPFIGVTDYMAAVPYQIAKWVPGDYTVLGTDGFGFADTRPAARRFFHVDAQSVVVAALQALAERGEIKRETVQEAFDKYRIDDPTAVRGVAQEGGDA